MWRIELWPYFRKAGITELAEQMRSGLIAHADLYPSVSPETTAAMVTAIREYNTARTAQGEAKAAAKNATIAKDAKQAALDEQMHKILYLAEHDCINNPGNLEYIGWSDRKPPTPLSAPGQPGELVPAYEGPGTLTLNWGKPATGGSVSSYRVERSDQPEGDGVPGPWVLINTIYTNKATLDNQPRGIEMQYRIIATNAAGDSMPSNIATVVL